MGWLHLYGTRELLDCFLRPRLFREKGSGILYSKTHTYEVHKRRHIRNRSRRKGNDSKTACRARRAGVLGYWSRNSDMDPAPERVTGFFSFLFVFDSSASLLALCIFFSRYFLFLVLGSWFVVHGRLCSAGERFLSQNRSLGFWYILPTDGKSGEKKKNENENQLHRVFLFSHFGKENK